MAASMNVFDEFINAKKALKDAQETYRRLVEERMKLETASIEHQKRELSRLFEAVAVQELIDFLNARLNSLLSHGGAASYTISYTDGDVPVRLNEDRVPNVINAVMVHFSERGYTLKVARQIDRAYGLNISVHLTSTE